MSPALRAREIGRLPTMGRDDAQAPPPAQAKGKAFGRRNQVTIHPVLLNAGRQLRPGRRAEVAKPGFGRDLDEVSSGARAGTRAPGVNQSRTPIALPARRPLRHNGRRATELVQ